MLPLTAYHVLSGRIAAVFPRDNERIAFAIVLVEVRYPDKIVGMALILWSMQ